MKNYRKARKTIDVTVGESVRIIRELQDLSQNELAEITGIPQSTISAVGMPVSRERPLINHRPTQTNTDVLQIKQMRLQCHVSLHAWYCDGRRR